MEERNKVVYGRVILAPWFSFHFEELITSKLVKKFPAFHRSRMFINLLTCLLHGTIPRIVWNLRFHYRLYKNPSILPTLRQINPVLASPSHILMIHRNIIFPSSPGSSKRSLPLRFPHQNSVCTSPPLYVPHAPSVSFFSI